MKRARFGRMICVLLLFCGISPALAQSAKDMLGVPGPVNFQDTDFALAWTSNPSPSYFKQEYVPTGEQVEHFNQMFMIEAETSATPEAAAAAQVDMLNKRKGSDPAVNYDVIRNDATGEIILDFVLSDSSTGTTIVEWNAYRYAPLNENGGVALYAISRRGYGDKARDFLIGLKEKRSPAINALASFDMPKLQPNP